MVERLYGIATLTGVVKEGMEEIGGTLRVRHMDGDRMREYLRGAEALEKDRPE